MFFLLSFILKWQLGSCVTGSWGASWYVAGGGCRAAPIFQARKLDEPMSEEINRA